MQIQLNLFGLTVVKLKAGKDKCPACGRLCRAYAKTLDIRLVQLAYDIAAHGTKRFRAKDIWTEHEKINDFQKLHYWGIIERKKGGYWELSHKGMRFLAGRLEMPKILWIFNNKIIEESSETVTVKNPPERWQENRQDYVLDYHPQGYKGEVAI